MQDPVSTETTVLHEIEEAELRLHRLYASRDRVSADERMVVEQRIRETKAEIEELRARLHP